MATSPATQAAQYPLAAYNFRVSVGSVTLGFAEVSGLQREHQTVTYRHGLSYWEGEAIAKFHIDKFAPMTLKKGVIKVGDHPAMLLWLEDPAPRNLLVSLCDETGTPVVNWTVAKALLVKIEAPSLVASGNDAAIDTLHLMVSGVRVEHV